MTDNRQPEALRLAEQYDYGDPATHGNAWKAAVCTELRRQHARIAELEAARFAYASEFEPNGDGYPDVGSIHANIRTMKAQLDSIRAGGVSGPLIGQPQAGAVPQGWKAVPVNPTPEMWKAAKSVPDPNPPYPPPYGLVWDAMLAASPTPTAEQAAPKAAPGEPAAIKMVGYGGCTGINDYLMSDGTIKTMRQHEVVWRETPLQAVAGEPVANDIHGALTAAAIYLTNAQRQYGKDMHQQAIASLEKAKRAVAQAADCAKAAPQQEPVALLVRKNSWRAGQWEAAPPDSPHYGLTWANQRKYVYEAPQPAPAPLSDDAKRLDWLDRNIFSREMCDWDAKYGHGPDYNMWVVFSPKGVQGSARNIIDAALAAQGGK